MTEDEFVASMAKYCKCCVECSPVVCAGVLGGGFCDRICYDHGEEEEDRCEDDFEEVAPCQQ